MSYPFEILKIPIFSYSIHFFTIDSLIKSSRPSVESYFNDNSFFISTIVLFFLHYFIISPEVLFNDIIPSEMLESDINNNNIIRVESSCCCYILGNGNQCKNKPVYNRSVCHIHLNY